MKVDNYKKTMLEHIEKESIEIPSKEVDKMVKKFIDFIKSKKSTFTTKEFELIMQSAESMEFGELYGLSKDHKDGNQLRIINPMNRCFLSGARRVVAKALQKMFVRNNVEWLFTIKNSRALKREIEGEMITNPRKSYLVAVDIINMYPIGGFRNSWSSLNFFWSSWSS